MTTTSAELKERRLEWAVAGIALVGGCAISAVALSYGVSHSTGVGAGFLPLVAGVVLGLAALAWLTQLALTRPAEGALATAELGAVSETPVHQAEERLDQLLEDAEVDETDEHSYPTALGWLRVATLAGSIAVAAILLNVLGYVLTMTGLLTTILIVIGRRKAWIAVAVAVAVALLSQLIFEGWLGTNLPHSTLAPFSTWGI
jgi:Tripartite tricarboxylate transporter TctB family